MYRQFHEMEAKPFQNDESCYIHVEMLDGQMEQLIAGDPLAMLYAIMACINQISFNTDNTFEDSMEVIETMYEDFIDGVMG